MGRSEALGVFWEGTEVDGVEVCGLWAPPTHPPRRTLPPPIDLWPRGTVARTWRLHGPGWRVCIWVLRIPEWPAGDEWPMAVKGSLQRMVDAGAAIAWIAAETEFADPPSLFDPDVMGSHLLAVLSEPTGYVGPTGAGDTVEWLSPAVQAVLRGFAASLIDLGGVDPEAS